MSKPAHYLKPAWVRRQLELAQPLLPPSSRAAVILAGATIAALGEGAAELNDQTAGIRAFPLRLEDAEWGYLLLDLPPDAAASADSLGQFLVHTLEGVLRAEHARYSVTQETLESYREMALMQRAVNDLNRSLKPAAVAAALLKEFGGRKDATDFGAVFLCADSGSHSLIESFGENAAALFEVFRGSPLYADMVERPHGDIINCLADAPLWAQSGAIFQSLLWLPLIAHDENLGMLVLASRRPDGYTAANLKRAQTLVSVAATALRNAQLYAAQEIMFQAFVKVIATAIDAKSPYTAGHCRRVPEIAVMIAEQADRADYGPFAGYRFDEDERNTLEIAAMLHDCGKVVTPEWVIDKAAKLDAIHDRIELVALRFEILRRDAQLALQQALAAGADSATVQNIYQARLRQLDDDFAFLEKCNQGGEFISPEHVRRIQAIAAKTWRDGRGVEHPMLSPDEAYNLCTPRGTLNPEERKIIENHAVHTINMLSQIPFPRGLRHVPEYAGGHHERLDGSGYPSGLKREQLSIPARIMAIADIFEALTAPDRPYRKAGTLSWAIKVMHRMKLDEHIDGDLFDLFLARGIHLAYAQKHLSPEQIDSIDVARYLGQEGRHI